MQNEWSLRTEIIQITHRWQIPALVFLIGSLLGWGLALLFPTNYRAEVPLYVAYNGDAIYTNPDDYKNWQISQLNDLTTTDDVIEETLHRLRQVDPYWETVDANQFREMTRVFWRNTGRWRMVIENPDRDRSALAVRVWSNVLIENYDEARRHAAQQIAYDKRLQAIADSSESYQEQLHNLNDLQDTLHLWSEQMSKGLMANPLDELGRWKLWYQAARIAEFNPIWQDVLEEYPPSGSYMEAYLAWIEKSDLVIREEVQFIENQLVELEQAYAQVDHEYQAVILDSRGLSANLEVGLQYFAPVEPEPIRQNGLVSLVGGILGIVIWSILWLARPVVRPSK